MFASQVLRCKGNISSSFLQLHCAPARWESCDFTWMKEA
nr:MAG TPA: hypothetical protein [Caudoviricetes sp.]